LKKPELTMHAVSLYDYPDLESVVEKYCAGCPGTEPRVRYALLATVISMFLDWENYKHDLNHYIISSDAASRLLYASAFVLHCFDHTEPNKQIPDIVKFLQTKADRGTPVFVDSTEFLDPEYDFIADKYGLKSSVFPYEIKRLVDDESMRFVRIYK